MAREMKDSGIEWIGEIPAEWKTANLRHVFSFGKGLPITKENLRETGVPVISYGQIHSKGNNGITVKPELIRYVDESYLESNPESLVQKEDFIFADTSEDLDGCGNSVFVDTEDPLFAGYHTIILRNKGENDNRYFAFLFQSGIWRKQIRGRVSGVKVFSISQRILRDSSLLVPPCDEQSRIADLLTRKCNQIDSVIDQTRASIEEYKKLKQAVITQAVTKGIRPDRQMKDSGVEWIGDIPADWGIIRCKYISSFINGFAFDSQDFMTNYVFPVIRIGDIRDGKIDTENCVGINNNTGLDKYLIHENDILLAMSGATVGKVGIACNIGKAYINQRVGIIRTICSKFLFYCLSTGSFVEYIILCASGSAQPNVSGEVYGKYYIPFPAISIQQEIVSYLDQKTSMIEMLIAKKENLLSSLESYKKSLIYEYVTGKKEVPA